jgi:hypothetical protein
MPAKKPRYPDQPPFIRFFLHGGTDSGDDDQLLLHLPIWLITNNIKRPYRYIRFIAYAIMGVDGAVYDKEMTVMNDISEGVTFNDNQQFLWKPEGEHTVHS